MIQANKQNLLSIFVLLFLAVGAFFMVNVELPEWSYLLSSINVLLFAVPVFYVTRQWLGWKNAIIAFVVLGVFALAIETSAIFTGFPYGHFGYSELLGYKILGKVPWTVAFAWTPLLLSAYAISANLFSNVFVRMIATSVILIIFDLTLDPGAVLLGFWQFNEVGIFYGVPLSNFVGWGFSGILGAALFELLVYLFKPLLPTPIKLINSSLFIIFFWTSIAFFGGLTFAFLIGMATVIALIFVRKRFAYRFDEMIVLVDDNNVPIATAPKLDFHTDATPLHRAFSVFLFNEQGQLMLQQRSFEKKTWGGVWSNSCCGHQILHKQTEATAKSRIKYELGINVSDLWVALPNYRYRAEKDGVVENEICPVLVGSFIGETSPNPAEVHETKWIKWNDFLADIEKPNCEFSPWAIEEAKLLANESKFNKWLAALNKTDFLDNK